MLSLSLSKILLFFCFKRRLSARSQPLPTWEGQVSVIFSEDVPLVHAEVSEVKVTEILGWSAN